MAMDIKEREYALWLGCVPGIGNRTIEKLLQNCGTPREIYEGGEALWRQFLTERQAESMLRAYAGSKPRNSYEELQKKGIRLVLQGDDIYPRRLRNIPDAPFLLFVKGSMPEEDRLAVAVVGARECSEYGRFVASELGTALGSRGVQVISGMARGIDGISQRAALEAGGMSFGVLGSGVDVCYPRENRELYDRLCGQGGILSTYPPGTEARPQNFPPRNRIVSGLADILVVIEARSRSGTLITVDMALEQGKEVYAAPGRVTDRLSDGCNRLLKQGAGVFISPEDFLEEVCGIKGPENGGNVVDISVPARLGQLSPQLREIYDVLDLQPKSLEEIQEELGAGHTAAHLTAQLMRLCMEELAVQLTPGHFMRRL